MPPLMPLAVAPTAQQLAPGVDPFAVRFAMANHFEAQSFAERLASPQHVGGVSPEQLREATMQSNIAHIAAMMNLVQQTSTAAHEMATHVIENLRA